MNKVAGALWVVVWLVLVSCSGKTKPTANQPQFEKPLPTGNTANLTGQQLAQGYCGSCHLFPDPNLLDKQTWKNGVLPNMALRLGLDLNGANPYAGMHFEEIPTVNQANVFANKPLISQVDWEKIVSYYDAAAPEKPLPPAATPAVKASLPLFTPKPFYFKHRKLPLTTLTKFDAAGGRLFLGDQENNLFILGKELKQIDSLRLESPAADIYINPDGSFKVLTLGVLQPSDRNKGSLTQYARNPDGTYTAQPLLQALNRPVEASYTDLNQDGLTDIVVCNYGNHTGKLVWFLNKGNNHYEEKILTKVPGSRNVVIKDFNRDGRPDIMLLAAQASESISLFFNQGKGNFEEKQVLRFPPVYGSSYLEVADFNHDGHPDILYTNGDNADYSVSLKRYHGIRIFLNDGRNNFKESWFYPLYGASKAIARDFDQDGDLDIAAIAFFPDFQQQPLNGFTYLENKGNLQFAAATFPQAVAGHWLTLEAGDLDQDGDQDLYLGSFIAAPALVPAEIRQKWFSDGPNMMVLLNKLKNKNNTQTQNRKQ
ncbi:hypothetical protein AAE02nite_30100 [Adhaeribacter aerolatus]|uniref:Cytochrome c domain-containing protein n=1 Tax=Adhaeribacter aerolatus TaxID=670289 RepID=A0A512B058_9BACT|nr:VCBS repeat-containing protein [Adhaeribacter aerolatus]GEO05346.1 hypothetical protein AAE02nite_30100 [Adhaeribacter aerolatus]